MTSATSSKHFFEHFFWIDCKIQDGKALAKIREAYPKKGDNNIFCNVPQFCFPDLENINPNETRTMEFTFVLTNSEGHQLFGFCRRVWSLGKPYPDCLCLMSYNPWFELYWQLLSIIESRMRASSIDALRNFLSTCYSTKPPGAGKRCSVCVAPTKTLPTKYVLRRQRKEEMPFGWMSLRVMAHSLDISKIIDLFSALISERRIVVHSKSLFKISSCCLSALSLLYPFYWQHIFVPIVPRSLIFCCNAPMPFFIGVHSSFIPEILEQPLSEVIFFDLDKNTCSTNLKNTSILPTNHTRVLANAIENAIANELKTNSFDDESIRKVQLEFYLSVFGTYKKFISDQGGVARFDTESFINSQNRNLKQFARTFSESQMFERFIAERLERYHLPYIPRDTFELEAELISAEITSPNLSAIKKSTRTSFEGNLSSSPVSLIDGDYLVNPPSNEPRKRNSLSFSHLLPKNLFGKKESVAYDLVRFDTEDEVTSSSSQLQVPHRSLNRRSLDLSKGFWGGQGFGDFFKKQSEEKSDDKSNEKSNDKSIPVPTRDSCKSKSKTNPNSPRSKLTVDPVEGKERG